MVYQSRDYHVYIPNTYQPARASLSHLFTYTNVYGTGFVKTRKTRHRIPVDIRIFLQCRNDVHCRRFLFAEDTQQEVSLVVRSEGGRHYDVVAWWDLVSTDHLARVAERRARHRPVVLEEVLVHRTCRLRLGLMSPHHIGSADNNKKHLKIVGPVRHCERFTLPFTRCRYCRTPPAHRCPRQRRQQR